MGACLCFDEATMLQGTLAGLFITGLNEQHHMAQCWQFLEICLGHVTLQREFVSLIATDHKYFFRV